jgi:phage shock protein A
LARRAYEHALKVKKVFMVEKERKTREAIRAIRAAERARWEREIAGALAAFDASGIHQTHDEMLARVEAQAARDHAYLDLALHSVDDGGIEIDEEVRRLEANEIVSRFERALGLSSQEREVPAVSDEDGGSNVASGGDITAGLTGPVPEGEPPRSA